MMGQGMGFKGGGGGSYVYVRSKKDLGKYYHIQGMSLPFFPFLCAYCPDADRSHILV